MRAPEGLPAREAASGRADRATRTRALAELLPAVGERRLRAVPAPRRHRQRQDRGLLPGRRGGARARARARSCSCPEIALTPMLVRAAAARASGRRSRCCTASSRRASATTSGGGSARARRASWWARARRSSRRCPSSASIVVDEEHDGGLQAGREPALPRPRRGGDARRGSRAARWCWARPRPRSSRTRTRSRGKYRELLAAARASAAQGLPQGRDRGPARGAARAGGEPILSPPLREALAARLARREQSLLLLNRRGYATSLLCRECGQEAMCPNCSVSLTLHRTGRLARCHYCGHEARAPDACPSCRGAYLRLTGFGTEQVAEAVRGGAARRRASSGSTATAPAAAASWPQTLAAFERARSTSWSGTQMIAKGHDFPRVTLVGVVDADVGLGHPGLPLGGAHVPAADAGRRAAPGAARPAGEVILQTHMPDHYALVHACAQDYAAFFEREMEFRRTMGYPPAAALVNLIVRAADEGKGRGGGERARRARCASGRGGATACSGPATRRSRACGRSTASRSCSRAGARRCARRCERALVARYGADALAGRRRGRRPAQRDVKATADGRADLRRSRARRRRSGPARSRPRTRRGSAARRRRARGRRGASSSSVGGWRRPSTRTRMAHRIQLGPK